tara:strand:- start:5 stop:655 length:651 start_codon:yes stop_codon:yes gene_type:complete
MKKSDFKAQIREEIIDILEAASAEDLAAAREEAEKLNKELEKTAQIQKDLSEGNDSDKFQDDGYVQHKYDDDVIDKYNIPVEPTAVFEDDSYADFQDIGQAYLENMGRPHSLNDDELEYLGKRIVKQLYKGDVSKAYDEIVMYDPRKLKEEDEEPKAGDLKGEPLSKIGYKLAATQEEMRKVVRKWNKMDEGPEKDKLYSRLKELNKIKKELESLL